MYLYDALYPRSWDGKDGIGDFGEAEGSGSGLHCIRDGAHDALELGVEGSRELES